MSGLEQLIAGYPKLFPRDSGTTGVEPDPFIIKWGWIYTVDNMANHDKTKWDYFMDMPIIQFLNLISYHMDLTGYEQRKK